MEDKLKKFNRFEKIFFRIHLGLFLFGAVLLGSLLTLQNSIGRVSETALGVVFVGFYGVIINFFISVIRLLKYLFGFKDFEERPTIRRSVIIMLTSPIALAVYYLLILAMALSMASCS